MTIKHALLLVIVILLQACSGARAPAAATISSKEIEAEYDLDTLVATRLSSDYNNGKEDSKLRDGMTSSLLMLEGKLREIIEKSHPVDIDNLRLLRRMLRIHMMFVSANDLGQFGPEIQSLDVQISNRIIQDPIPAPSATSPSTTPSSSAQNPSP
jgi:hypothetical protein